MQSRPSRSASKLVLGCALAASVACESAPPRAPVASAPAPSSGEVVLPVRAFHTITVAQCAREGAACDHATAGAPPGPAYVVAFGTSGGSTRSRDQAMADLYRELRDRTVNGTHLVARPHPLPASPSADGSPAAADDAQAKTSKSSDDTEPLVQAAVALMKLVDKEGEVTIDRTSANSECKVALADADVPDASAGVANCFLKDERPRSAPGRGGLTW